MQTRVIILCLDPQKHSESVLSLINKPGKLKPMFGKTHNENTKKLMSI